ncbi:hypothetical protein [Paraglaciecola sp. 25GB23A]|uniref:hypothetical protein n=1 Tax=Paraglaciecola sp. 25GB23A TaxID=3156068 RepID=UPI0032AF3DA9
MQSRYYDPVIGRFYSNDPVATNGQLSLVIVCMGSIDINMRIITLTSLHILMAKIVLMEL